MVYRGTVKNGIVVFDEGATPPDGARVVVQPADGVEQPPEPPPGSLAERLLKLAGTCTGLPPDFASQHDHYLYGTPKR